ncbi:AraC family transcriptional regulator [Marinobacter sp. F4216]|uniref:AraC family transcriptional regulator n=1 Tax=Marinobacter sp. F4216 TaxID=2874281 RepID=UPI001CC0D1C2|nr:AraC family transcriptional regulator [Marinobacter sp. F4216]MBZ2168371.1 AraC family transcriptional regulator [Marinobacter sp. F4216]
MTTSELVRASSLARFDEYCEKYGLDHQRMLHQAGLPMDLLDYPESFISYSRFATLLANCAGESKYPLFALKYGIFQGTDVFGRLLYLFKNAETVGDSIHELTNYFHLHESSGRLSTAVEGHAAILSYEPALREGIPGRHAAELAVGIGKALLTMLLGAKWNPTGVHLRSGPGDTPDHYKRILGVAPQFNSVSNSWVFDAKLLDTPLSDSDPALHALMREHLEEMDDLSPRELPEYVRYLVKNFLPSGRANISQISSYMMLSSRTLQRYLSEERTSFQKLLDETRQSMAQRYLHESSISLTQLAGILGYSDLAAFSRAFQRWYGVSPRHWRKERGIRSTTRLSARRTHPPSWLK